MPSVIPVAVVSVFIVLDILTGLAQSVKTHSFKSSVMREGLFHKSAELFVCFFMYGLRYALPYIGIQTTLPFVEMTTAYIGLMEVGSIFENVSAINPELKDFLNGVFETFRKEDKPDE